MALPRLNTSPKYELTIPSSGKKVPFRPFVVKEEKALMIALEGGDPESILYTLTDIIDSCTEMDRPAKELASFDVEYIFLKLRAKSVGESAKVGLKCEKCEALNEISMNLDAIEIEMPDVERKVDMGNDIIVELEYPSYNELISTTLVEGETQTEQVMKVIQKCIVAVSTEDERILVEDLPEKEIEEFLDSMNAQQFDKIRQFVENFPKLQHDVEFDCTGCGEHNKVNVEGMNNFLS